MVNQTNRIGVWKGKAPSVEIVCKELVTNLFIRLRKTMYFK